MIMYFPFFQLLLDLPHLPNIPTFYFFLCLKKTEVKTKRKKTNDTKMFQQTKQKTYNHHLAHLVLVNYLWACAFPGVLLAILTMSGNLSFEYFRLL